VARNLLLDANLPPSLVARLAENGIRATHIGARNLGQASDEFLVEHARERGEILVTHDLDFSRILAASGESSPSVIILRIRLPLPGALAAAIRTAVQHAEADLLAGAIVMVEDGAIRVRALPVAAAR
jgi:predicted nuclease of predicted toxin-antitoxin system